MHRYSHRLSWPAAPNQLSRLVSARRAAGIRVLDLTVSNPTEALCEYPHSAIRDALGRIQNFSYEPDPLGSLLARQRIVDYYGKRGISASTDRIVVTASTSEAYALCFKMLCDPGDEILVPAPSYPLFEFLAALECVRIVPYRIRYDGSWFVDWPSMEEHVSTRTRAIVIVHPNNPTGSFFRPAEIDRLLSFATASDIPIISDEVFSDYAFASDAPEKTLIGRGPALSFSLNGLSKTAGMPQMKLAWVVINGVAEHCRLARERLELLNDTYLSVGTPVQAALGELFDIGDIVRQDIRRRTERNLRAIDELLAGTPAHRLHSQGGWSAIIRLPNVMSEESWVTALLDEEHVLVQPGYFFDMAQDTHIVVSLLTPPDQLDDGVSRLRIIMNRYCGY